MLIPSENVDSEALESSLSRGMNANSQHHREAPHRDHKSIKRDEC